MSEGSNKLRGVDIFATGHHRDKPYTRKDLDDIVANFERHSIGERPSLRVPAVLGHEERQDMLERSDLPAAGWTSRVYRDGDKLKADFENVPPQVMRLLKGKAYRSTSAEIYDKPPHGVPDTASGKMLRRVAFLGGDIPQVKSLDEIPVPHDYHETSSFDAYTPTTVHFHECHELPAGCFACFSEVSPMTREEMLVELGQRGLDVGQITEAVPDALLSDMLRIVSSQPEPEPEEPPPEEAMPEEPPPEEATAEEPPPEEPPPEEHDEYEEEGVPVKGVGEEEVPGEADQARKMFEKAYYHVEKHCGSGSAARMMEHLHKAGELHITHDVDDEHKPEEEEEETPMPAKYSEQKLAAMVTAAVAKVLKSNADRTSSDLVELKKFREEHIASAKRASIDRFIKAETLTGRILPYEVDPKNPANLRKRLLRADSKTVVEKFSEKGKTVKLTELDLQMREIRNRRPFKFSETLKSGKTHDADADEAALTDHFELFSEQFTKNNVTRDKLMAGYKAEKQMNPTLTVKEFLRN